jgi:hypothetical protein
VNNSTSSKYKIKSNSKKPGALSPSRFYPKYLLAKLYDETGQKEKAIQVANELLAKDIKIESTAIEEIKEEMKKLINK